MTHPDHDPFAGPEGPPPVVTPEPEWEPPKILRFLGLTFCASVIILLIACVWYAIISVLNTIPSLTL